MHIFYSNWFYIDYLFYIWRSMQQISDRLFGGETRITTNTMESVRTGIHYTGGQLVQVCCTAIFLKFSS